jgi:hypothetical protein
MNIYFYFNANKIDIESTQTNMVCEGDLYKAGLVMWAI